MEDITTASCPGCQTEVPLDKKMVCQVCGLDISSLGRLQELPLAYYNEGLKLAREGKLDEALEKLATATELKRNFPAPLEVMAKIFAQKGLLAEASHCWERVLVMEPGNQAAQNGLVKARELLVQAGAEPVPEGRSAALPAGPGPPADSPMPGPVSPWLKVAAGLSGLAVVLLMAVLGLLWHNLINESPSEGSPQAGIAEMSILQQSLADQMEAQHERLRGLEAKLAALQKPPGNPTQTLGKSENRREPAKSLETPNLIEEDYEVYRGDTLRALAQRFLASEERWPEIYRLNRESLAPHPDRLPVGQKIKILRKAQ
jgi:tetratricopeptide (TPR) repeat protein